MTWADFYLVCFVAGFFFSFFSFIAGGMRWHLHLPHVPHGVGHAPAAHGGGAPHPSPGGLAKAGSRVTAHSGQVSPFNFVTFTAFLAWFGGIGFLLTRFSRVWFVMGLGIALVSGLGGATIIYLFISRVLTSQEENMDPADYDMIGVLGKICSSVGEGGTGELIYSQAGTRRVCGVRAENGAAIPKDSEVVVTRYERGIAYVRLWEEMAAEAGESQSASGPVL
ncbi:MAG TPA: hypothetical protein VFA89_02650 [Terriglobales bacterium]|nr:hypothetical protein [Terriglobales bacterium]